MLLTTTGAKSGQARTLPLLYLTDGERLILIASNYGKPPGVVPATWSPSHRRSTRWQAQRCLHGGE